ncbi:hypothetical protein H0H92_003539 [Tricholoma furcatifolium]|nr:hypothetical protein H0H92_003539 [Tricholoma furcatifolium]
MSDSLQARLQIASVDFQKIQAELSAAVESRQRLDAQLSENELVKKVAKRSTQISNADMTSAQQEFALLTPENKVFKVMGPVLVKQDQAEAKSNVETRLEFIRSEMCVVLLVMMTIYSLELSKRVEMQLKDIEGRQERKKGEVRNEDTFILFSLASKRLSKIVEIQTALQQLQSQQKTTPIQPSAVLAS